MCAHNGDAGQHIIITMRMLKTTSDRVTTFVKQSTRLGTATVKRRHSELQREANLLDEHETETNKHGPGVLAVEQMPEACTAT